MLPPTATGPSSPPPKRPRRRLALSLRALMLLVLVVGGLTGWKARRAALQRRAVAVVRMAGGIISYDYQARPGGFDARVPDPMPAWLQRLAGVDLLHDVAAVRFRNFPEDGGPTPTLATWAEVAALPARQVRSDAVPVDDDALARLASMPHLAELMLHRADVTDPGVARLADRVGLEVLRISMLPDRPRLSSASLRTIGRLARLRDLWVDGIDLVKPADLAPLAGLARLEEVRFDDSPGDVACLDHLRASRGLRLLALRQTRLTDDGAARLAAWPGLQRIYFAGMGVTDRGLEHLAALAKLTAINLPGSDVTDAGLDRLASLKLDQLSVSGRGVTDAGLVRLVAGRTFLYLNLAGTGITDEGLAALAGQAGLANLDLSRTGIGDAGMVHLARLRSPYPPSLTLAGTNLTDAGLAVLARSFGGRVDVRGTRVTPAGVAAYRTARGVHAIDADDVAP